MSDIQDVKAVIDNVCRMAAIVPIEDARALVSEFSKMETLMPIMDPTGYMAIAETLQGHEMAAQAFLSFRISLENLKEAEEQRTPEQATQDLVDWYAQGNIDISALAKEVNDG